MNRKRPSSNVLLSLSLVLPFSVPSCSRTSSSQFSFQCSLCYQYPLEIFYSMTRTTLRNPSSTTLKINFKTCHYFSVSSFSLCLHCRMYRKWFIFSSNTALPAAHLFTHFMNICQTRGQTLGTQLWANTDTVPASWCSPVP